MITAHELARVLLAGPNCPVVTWQNRSVAPTEACDSDVEAVIEVEGHKGPVVVIGMDIDGTIVEGAEVVWADSEGALRGIVRAQERMAAARREVG